MKKVLFLLYAWGSTFLFIALLFWLATVPNLSTGNEDTAEMIKIFYRLILYSVLFILVYRSIIITLKSTVTRLAAWKSRREKHEDAEFVLIIETLAVTTATLFATVVALVEEFLQLELNVDGRNVQYEDVLVSVMGILLAAIVSYSLPIIGELEVAVKHRVEEVLKNKKK